MTNPHRIGLIFVIFMAYAASAETIRLKNGESVEGVVQHYYGGILSLVLRDGTTRTYGRNDLAAVEFEPGRTPEASVSTPTPAAEPNFLNSLSKPSAPFSSPAATFEKWKSAATKGDVDRMVECYASFRQKEIRKQLKELSKEDREKMQETTGRTDFVPAEPLYQGDRAFLEVRWQSGLSGDSQVLQFILEKNDWKLIQ